jgi:hypothetical protein
MRRVFGVLGIIAGAVVLTFIVLCIVFVNVINPGSSQAVPASEVLEVFLVVIPALVFTFAIVGAVALSRSQARHRGTFTALLIIGGVVAAIFAYLIVGFAGLLAIPPTGW